MTDKNTPAPADLVEQIGDWTIWFQPWPIETRSYDWHFAHENVAVAEELSGHCESREMCLQAIDWLEEQEAHRETEEGRAETERFVDAGMRALNRALLAEAVRRLLSLPGIGNLPGFATGTHLNSARYALDQYDQQISGKDGK